jgi:hypothetical protein
LFTISNDPQREWSKEREAGPTQQRNWWPEIYRAAGRHRGSEPDPKLLAYNTSGEDTRADLKSGSGGSCANKSFGPDTANVLVQREMEKQRFPVV